MATQITEHFTLEEFACKDGTSYPAEWVADRLTPLCQMLEIIREASGGPMHILCGYRTQAYNERLAAQGHNVALYSEHIPARAADICSSILAPHALHDLILDLQTQGKLPTLGGLGSYAGWVHVDIRPWQGHLCRWDG